MPRTLRPKLPSAKLAGSRTVEPLMPLNRMKVSGVGVDLVSIDRIKKFMAIHRQRAAQRLMTEQERKLLDKRKLTPLYFSKLFAAKEAYFKAARKSWMGPDGFQSIEVRLQSGNRFVAFTQDSRREHCRGEFFRKGKYLGARIVLWKSF